MLSFFTNPDESLEFYNNDGYFIEHNLLSYELCDQLIEESKTFESYLDGTCKPYMMPHRHNKVVFDAMANEKLRYIMSLLVGGEASGLQTEFFYCKPGTKGFSLHQDNFFVEAKQEVFASAWIALTDTSKTNGGLIGYPGSHKEPLLPTRPLSAIKDIGQDPNSGNEETIVPPQYQPVDAIVPKGSAFFIHGHFVHGSNPNLSDNFRHVLLCTYIKKGENFRPGRYAKREAIDFSTPVLSA